MSLEQIKAAIPHREPFLLLDEIIEQVEKRIVCRKTFSGDEFWYHGHYPNQPITPGVLLCEAGMQAGAVLHSQHGEGDHGVPVAKRINDVKFKSMVKPGETLELIVQLNERLADAFFLTCKITVEGRAAATFNFACTVAKPT
jgi:3-hydroxyacyl-[acyl-carrier-protein] dehydratase